MTALGTASAAGFRPPLSRSLASWIETEIIVGNYPEDEALPSSSELAVIHDSSPSTTGKSLRLLSAQGFIHTRRGIGAFVSPGARERLRRHRREQFADRYLQPLLSEARRIDMDTATVLALITSREQELADGS
ncbi:MULTISPECIES: GntR family transcriptional regulator [unclassified Microbacterium]|uniref:GntR family transcriptional regulator n=1 Tax=unclassified Microbacterium TaxID=2609290 RepID=UPI0016035B04|nr:MULTISPECIES: GntR family transcriptional regulator [unclassified Microbacterium]MBT2486605.1 GntR family transcriptional regulator [Microbacterium sp. ISL-108]